MGPGFRRDAEAVRVGTGVPLGPAPPGNAALPEGWVAAGRHTALSEATAIKNWASDAKEMTAGDGIGGDDTERDRRPPPAGQHRGARLMDRRLPGARRVVAVLWL